MGGVYDQELARRYIGMGRAHGAGGQFDHNLLLEARARVARSLLRRVSLASDAGG